MFRHVQMSPSRSSQLCVIIEHNVIWRLLKTESESEIRLETIHLSKILDIKLEIRIIGTIF